MNVSSWPQVGRAVAALLSLPVQSDEGAHSLEQFENRWVYPTSFLLSQNDMLESVYRVTGTSQTDWTIKREPVKQRWEDAKNAMYAGEKVGFEKQLYARGFFEDEPANVEKWKVVHNDVLGLEKEDVDTYTKVAIDMVQEMAEWRGKNLG